MTTQTCETRREYAHSTLEAAFRCGLDVEDLNVDGMRTIARALASYAFRMGPCIWDANMAKLRREWDAYCMLDEAAGRIEDEMNICPF